MKIHHWSGFEFAESNSASFDEALRIAKKAPDYQECIRDRKEWYLASWETYQFYEVVVLAQALKGARAFSHAEDRFPPMVFLA